MKSGIMVDWKNPAAWLSGVVKIAKGAKALYEEHSKDPNKKLSEHFRSKKVQDALGDVFTGIVE